MSVNIGSMNPDEVNEYVNYNKAYAIHDSASGVVQLLIFPNDVVAKRTFKEMCANIPDSTVDCLTLRDLGFIADLDISIDITPEI